MSETHDIRLKRLTMRAGHRGIKEMDIIFGAWAEARLAMADEATLDLFEEILEESDQDLYQWVSGQAAAPARFSAMIADMRQVMETRAR